MVLIPYTTWQAATVPAEAQPRKVHEMNTQTSWLVGFAITASIVASGCSQPRSATPTSTGSSQMHNVLIHIDGFQKTKTGIV